MIMKKLYDPNRGQMRVVGLMSGGGSNLRKIIEHEKFLEEESGSPYTVVAIFSDAAGSNAVAIGRDYDLPVVIRDINSFHSARNEKKRNLLKLEEEAKRNPELKAEYERYLGLRMKFDVEIADAVAPFRATVAAYAGYMSIATQPLMQAFLGVNVHPADLSLVSGEKRKYTGDHAVRDAILAGEKQLRSSTHIIEPHVDYGGILMISQPIQVQLPQDFDPENKDLVNRVAERHQNRLKESGDWIIFPRTLVYLAQGRYEQDYARNLYFDGQYISSGVRME